MLRTKALLLCLRRYNTNMAVRLPNARLSRIALICAFLFSITTFTASAQSGERNLLSPAQASIDGRQTSSGVEPLRFRDLRLESADSQHRFLDNTNISLFSGIAVFRVLDYTSTRNMLARGREEKLIPDDVVRSTPGFASLEAAGAATSIGISYLLHRTGHHKLERWLSIGHITVTGFGAARNYALESRHR